LYNFQNKIFSFAHFSHNFQRVLFTLVFIAGFAIAAEAQDTLLRASPDTLRIAADTLLKDSTGVSKKKDKLNAKVEYNAIDSISFDLDIQKVFLYKEAEINYEKTNLKAAYIEINFKETTAFAKGVTDSTEKETGTPVFKDGDKSFKSKILTYNFETKKGIIANVITQEGEGFLHGETVKKLEDNTTNAHKGGYTTCNLDHPHFELHYTRAKVIPDNKIVTGPIYLSIADVPLPLALPFGLFPNKKGRSSGIIIPSYGEAVGRGFFFENGGYYWGISDYMDLEVRGDIYTRGSWAVKPKFNYKKRYKFNGNLDFGYAINKLGTEGTPDYSKSRDFYILWSHRQDPKARPKSNFSANVNIQSNKFNRYNPVSANNYLSNTFNSSISYQYTEAGKYFFTANLNHTQNTINKTISLSLPDISFSVNQFYPFRKQKASGKQRWYENISINYRMNAKNEVSTYDSLLFKQKMYDDFRYGMQHSIPISSSIKILKYFNLTNAVGFNDKMYGNYIQKTWINDTLIQNNDTVVGYVKTDTISGFRQAIDFNFSSSLSTKLYGMLQFKKGPVRAIRHVLTPNVGFSYRPDFGAKSWGYYKEVQKDTTGNIQRYSVFSNGIFGSPPDKKSGSLNFSLSNNLEMKVRSRKDTVTGMRKIVLIENFTISTSYDLAKDSMRWSRINMNGHTRLFKNVQIQYGSQWDPYALDSTHTRNINVFEWDKNHRLLRLVNTSWNFGLNWNISSQQFQKKEAQQLQEKVPLNPEIEQIISQPGDYINWNNAWSANINYTFRYQSNFNATKNAMKHEIIQSLSFSGDLSITSKWKLSVMSGYDFKNSKITYTSVNIIRDLHCWEMRLNWIPIGGMKSWNFQINVKASVLQDLKLTKKKDFRDRWE